MKYVKMYVKNKIRIWFEFGQSSHPFYLNSWISPILIISLHLFFFYQVNFASVSSSLCCWDCCISPQLVLATAASCDCEGFIFIVAGTTIDGAAAAAAPTANMVVNLTHLLHLFLLCSSFSLSAFQLHLFAMSFTLNSVQQGARVSFQRQQGRAPLC